MPIGYARSSRHPALSLFYTSFFLLAETSYALKLIKHYIKSWPYQTQTYYRALHFYRSSKVEILQRVLHAIRGHLLLRTPIPIPFGTYIDKSLSKSCHNFIDIAQVFGHFRFMLIKLFGSFSELLASLTRIFLETTVGCTASYLKANSRKYQGVFKVKSRVKTRQVRLIWSQDIPVDFVPPIWRMCIALFVSPKCGCRLISDDLS